MLLKAPTNITCLSGLRRCMVDQAVQMSPSDLVWVTWPHSKEVKCVQSQICCEGGLGSRVGGGSNRESSVPPGAALGSWDGEKVGVNVVKVGSGARWWSSLCVRRRILHWIQGEVTSQDEGSQAVRYRKSLHNKKTNKNRLFFSFLVTHWAQISTWHFSALLSPSTFPNSLSHTFIDFPRRELDYQGLSSQQTAVIFVSLAAPRKSYIYPQSTHTPDFHQDRCQNVLLLCSSLFLSNSTCSVREILDANLSIASILLFPPGCTENGNTWCQSNVTTCER